MGKATASRDRFQQGKSNLSKASQYGSRKPGAEAKRASISKEIKMNDVVKQASLISKLETKPDSARRDPNMSVPFYTQSNTPLSQLIPDSLD